MNRADEVKLIIEPFIRHFWVDEDNWYSCPKAPDGCSDESQGTECNCGRDKKISKIVSALLSNEEARMKPIRKYLWLNHKTKGVQCIPYGDDGEMQCCGIDFKRQEIDEILEYIYKRREQSLGV